MLRPIQLNLSQSDMDIRIGNKLFVITLLIFLLGSSCTNSSISEMEELVGIPMKRELTLSTEYSQWNDFNGDGYKIEVYNVSKEFIQLKLSDFKSKGFDEYNSALWKRSEIYPYIKNSHGIYKIYNTRNEVDYIFINIDKSTIVYFVNIL